MNQTPIELRLIPVSLQDADAVADLRAEAMRESLERVGRFDEQRVRDRLLAGFVAQFTRHIEDAGDRVGFVVVVPQPDHLSLDHFYIHPRSQGAGVGSAVLRELFVEADLAGSSIRVGALKQSDSNRFYLRHGFEFVESTEFDNYYIRSPTFPLMRAGSAGSGV